MIIGYALACKSSKFQFYNRNSVGNEQKKTGLIFTFHRVLGQCDSWRQIMTN